MTAQKKAFTQRKGATKKVSKKRTTTPQVKRKIEKVMKEFKEGKLHSRSDNGPKVKSRKQAIAIALHEAGVSNSSRGTPKKTSRKTSKK
jgi:hypothetical protein